MLQQYLMQQEEVILGWGFFVPLALMIVMILLAFRICGLSRRNANI